MDSILKWHESQKHKDSTPQLTVIAPIRLPAVSGSSKRRSTGQWATRPVLHIWRTCRFGALSTAAHQDLSPWCKCGPQSMHRRIKTDRINEILFALRCLDVPSAWISPAISLQLTKLACTNRSSTAKLSQISSRPGQERVKGVEGAALGPTGHQLFRFHSQRPGDIGRFPGTMHDRSRVGVATAVPRTGTSGLPQHHDICSLFRLEHGRVASPMGSRTTPTLDPSDAAITGPITIAVAGGRRLQHNRAATADNNGTLWLASGSWTEPP